MKKDTAILNKKIEQKKLLAKIAYAFMIVGTVLSAFCFLIPLAWTIPMTLRTKMHACHPQESSCIVLGVCAIFFTPLFGIVAGILLIIANAFYDPEDTLLPSQADLKGPVLKVADEDL